MKQALGVHKTASADRAVRFQVVVDPSNLGAAVIDEVDPAGCSRPLSGAARRRALLKGECLKFAIKDTSPDVELVEQRPKLIGADFLGALWAVADHVTWPFSGRGWQGCVCWKA